MKQVEFFETSSVPGFVRTVGRITFAPTHFGTAEKTGEELKRDGMDAAASNAVAQAWLERARERAYQIAKRNGTVNADEVREACEAAGDTAPSPQVCGSVFKVGFVFTGERIKSTHKDNHARELKLWKIAV